MEPRKIVFLGLSITSSWGNGHATTYRALLKALAACGHEVLFLERDVPWYAEHRDLPSPPFCRTELYEGLEELRERFGNEVASADVVVVGSYVPDGTAVARWVLEHCPGVVAFYDIDTPVTLSCLEQGGTEYLSPGLIPRFDLYLSFTGGPTLARLEHHFGAARARALYCSVDPECYYPEKQVPRWDLGYLGTYAPDRQPAVERLLIEPARLCSHQAFVVAGPQYPEEEIDWPGNTDRIDHLPPPEHRAFYNAQRFTLNVTRVDMVRLGYSPSVRLFEAAACGVPIISDYWSGLETVFTPGKEVLVARTPWEVVGFLRNLPEEERAAIGERARQRVLAEHTAADRAAQFEIYIAEAAVAGQLPKGRGCRS